MPVKPFQMDMFNPFGSGTVPGGLSPGLSYREALGKLLKEDLDFHGETSSYATHNFHAFPAKFPPQLPRKFIQGLTLPGEWVLDPMAGSGTTILEAVILGRNAIGVDIDPLALNLCKVKVTPLDPGKLMRQGESVLGGAKDALMREKAELLGELNVRFDPITKKFTDYWFQAETQIELVALLREIEAIKDVDVSRFFRMVFSSIIITKSGGVSLAYDLAHTRPHKLSGKAPQPAVAEFEKRLNKAIKAMSHLLWGTGQAQVLCCTAQGLGLADRSIDFIVTSPPYASNAIDYMRAHKFSLVWFGYPINSLSRKRATYIGGERTKDFIMGDLPGHTERVIAKVGRKDSHKGEVLRRYYTEMAACLKEMFRVLKPGKGSVVVVGSSIMRGVDTETGVCLADIGESNGFEVVGIAERRLDRNRRMMPARENGERASQIEERMHEEYVIGLYKSE
jgi:DNA modification methylase